MALVERLCQIKPDEPGGEPYARHIAREDFYLGLMDILGGYHTVNQMKTFYNMIPVDEAEFDTLLTQVNSASDLVRKRARIERINSILAKWERKEDLNLAGYDTVSDIRIQLNSLDTGWL